MGFSFHLTAVKRLSKKKMKKTKENVRSTRRRRRSIIVKPDSKLSVGIENIPDDLLMEILKKLPAKVVLESMRVSWLWYSLIASSHFTNLFLASSTKPMRFVASLVGLQDEPRHVFLSSSLPQHVHDHSDTSVSVLDRVLRIRGMGGYVVNALHNLLCVRLYRSFRICNLTTKQLVELPFVESQILNEPLTRSQLWEDEPIYKRDIWTSFGYDHVHNEYKLLNIVSTMRREDRIVRSEHQVLVLGPEASWRSNKGYTCPPHRPCSKGILIKGVLYYGVCLDENKCALMSFDFVSEDFKLIELPIQSDIIWSSNCSSLMNYKDKIGVFKYPKLASDPSIRIDLWVLEDLKTMEWSTFTLMLPSNQMNFVSGHPILIHGFNSSCQLFLGESTQPLSYVYFDLEKNKTTRRLEVRLPKRLKDFYYENPFRIDFWEDNIENIMYLET